MRAPGIPRLGGVWASGAERTGKYRVVGLHSLPDGL